MLYIRDLYLLFRRHGDILSVHIMVNKVTGLSKGYGFVSFANPTDAQTAIESLDGFRVSYIVIGISNISVILLSQIVGKEKA